MFFLLLFARQEERSERRFATDATKLLVRDAVPKDLEEMANLWPLSRLDFPETLISLPSSRIVSRRSRPIALNWISRGPPILPFRCPLLRFSNWVGRVCLIYISFRYIVILSAETNRERAPSFCRRIARGSTPMFRKLQKRKCSLKLRVQRTQRKCPHTSTISIIHVVITDLVAIVNCVIA